VLPPEWGVGVRVRIEVSGVSTLTIAPQGLTIHHYEGIAPGQAGVGMSEEAREARPTIINGQHWAPEWPEDGQNVDCDCTSSTFHAPDGVLGPQVESMIDLSILRGRGLVKTVMGPTADNDYTTVIQIDDSAYNGPAWYEVELSYPEL